VFLREEFEEPPFTTKGHENEHSSYYKRERSELLAGSSAQNGEANGFAVCQAGVCNNSLWDDL
jgi:hypothetical protein